jgi:serine/threonine protein kinase
VKFSSKALVFLTLLTSLKSYAVLDICIKSLVQIAQASAERFPTPGIENYRKLGTESEEKSHKGNIFEVVVVKRLSDSEIVAHRRPMDGAPMQDERWESLKHQDRVLKQIRKDHPRLAKVTPKTYGFKYNGTKKVWESEFIEGDSVLHKLKEIETNQNLSNESKFKEALILFRKTYEAYQTLHKADTLHMDAKGANSVLCPDGSVLIIDFAGAVYRPKKGKAIIPSTIHYEADYIPPEINPQSLGKKELLNLPYNFDFYTLAKSFHKKIFLGLKLPDYLAYRKDPEKLRMINFFKEYEEKIYKILTSTDPETRDRFDIKSLDALIESMNESGAP